jgi:hypothetical protein
MGKKTYKKRLLDVRQDRLDLRDRVYQPVLKSLEATYPKTAYINHILECYREENLILDQGDNGACSGYALASVINYLLWKQKNKEIIENSRTKKMRSEIVSSKMLFNLARIYDEWDGEDYEGSSCRGAMKGWHKHGVCSQSYWEFDQDEPQKGWDTNSIEKPLGAYYRVDKDSITDIQAALCEVGALYVSASIHDGWWELNNYRDKNIKDIESDLPTIPYEAFSQGNHAFVIVGYTRHGFIIQNSWGRRWGNCGFAILSYKEWLKNGLDVWVAVMGVPIDIENSSQTITTESLSSASKVSEDVEVKNRRNSKNKQSNKEENAYNHTLVLNSNGRAKHTIISTSSLKRSIEIICYDNLKTWLSKTPKNRKIMIYALGGLDSEKEYIVKIKKLIPYFLNNGIYPIFLTWQQSYQKAIEESIETFFKETLNGKNRQLEEKILKDDVALNRAIENYCKQISTRGVWVEMKEQSHNAIQKKVKGFSRNRSGILYLLTKSLKKLSDKFSKVEVHAMAHSAGSELLTTSWLKELEKQKIKLCSLHLLAPTVSIQDSNTYIIKAYKRGVISKKDIHIYILDKEMENADNVSKYSKSLLYLISRSLEKIHKTPLLGLLDSWDDKNSSTKDGVFNTSQLNDLKKWNKFTYELNNTLFPYILKKEHSQLACSNDNDYLKLSHKTLDRSLFILERVLKIVSTDSKDGNLKYKVKTLC